MRAYSVADEEAIRIRDLLKDWTSLGLIAGSQRLKMQQDIPCELRRTNVFLRAVLFVFTVLSVAAAVALFFVIFSVSLSSQSGGTFLLFVAGACYAAAEVAISQFRLYRYGIEEALVALSIAFLCLGLRFIFPSSPHSYETVVLGTGAVAAYLLYRRFGFQYLLIAVMAFVAAIPQFWTDSHSGRHLIVAIFYVAGLAILVRRRPAHRFDYLNAEYSLIEALLWFGLYLCFNLHLSALKLLATWWNPDPTASSDFSRPFYWATFALIWLLPVIILRRAVTTKDRNTILLGLIVAILTLATNKPYLGLPHHAWDPIILGVVLIAAAIVAKRWLARDSAGVRCGFTAQRLSARDQQWITSVYPTMTAALPNPATLTPIAPEHQFGGGSSGGGGASSDF